MQKYILAFMLCLMTSGAWAAFESDVVLLSPQEVHDLADNKLINAYMDTIVEIDAQKAFHATSGFSAKDYKAFKIMLKFRLVLLEEIHKRKIEIPQFDRFSN